MRSALALQHPAARHYFQQLEHTLTHQPDGSWLGRDEHQQLFQRTVSQGAALTADLQQVLQRSSSLLLRSEALRLAAQANLQQQLLPVLRSLLERDAYRPILGRKLEALREAWSESNDEKSLLDQHVRYIESYLWFGLPGQANDIVVSSLQALGAMGEPGLFAVDQFLGRILDEGFLMSKDHLHLFHKTADLFVQHRYFEGVQIFFDFLADCAPVAPQKEDLSTIGALLKAVRKLRPYRYPQWASPLKRFVQHFRAINQHGRAVEANMLIILIMASSADEALLLEDDELVDLLRGRRDSAYTEEELTEVAALCDAILKAGRTDARMYHIRGWLAARLEGPDAAEPFFRKAVAANASYVYPHLALAAIYEMRGEEGSRDRHLAAACKAEPSQISCHRRYGELLQNQGRYDEAIQVYEKGLQTQPDQITVLELEEYFGCLASLASFYADRDDLPLAIATLERTDNDKVEAIFTSRFCDRHRVILDLLLKGLRDMKAEFEHAST